MRVAVLDKDLHLVGAQELDDEDDVPENAVPIDPGDLPLTGEYKWHPESAAFVPLGHGFPRISSEPPVSTEWVLAKIVAMLGDELPMPCLQWRAWYDSNLKQRDEERRLRKIRRR